MNLIINRRRQNLKRRMQGYLQVWQGILSRWVKTYFVLNDDTLHFGEEKSELTCKVHLKICEIISSIENPIQFIIHTGIDPLYLRAYSIEEKVKWYKKLKSKQKQIKNKYYHQEIKMMKHEIDDQQGHSFKIKSLGQMNVELWKCHAELEKRLEETISKLKVSISTKNILDKLQIIIEEFKFKTTEILQIIQEEINLLGNQYHNQNNHFFNNFANSSHHSQKSQEVSRKGSHLDSSMKVSQQYQQNNKHFPSKASSQRFSNQDFNQLQNYDEKNRYDEINQTKYFSFYAGGKKSQNENGKITSKIQQQKHKNQSPFKIFEGEEEDQSDDRYKQFEHDLFNKKGRNEVDNSMRKKMSELDSKGYLLKEVVDFNIQKLLKRNKIYKLIPDLLNEKHRGNVRKSLPKMSPQLQTSSFPLFNTITQSLVKNQNKILFPSILSFILLLVSMYEPLSTLQRQCEKLFYCELLKKADQENDEIKRMAFVTAFIVSMYSLEDNRIKKSFTGLPGQTYEYSDQYQKDFQFIAEQISENTSALHVRSNQFQMHQNLKTIAILQPTSIKFYYQSKTILKLQKYQETYIISNRVPKYLKNILFGQPFIEYIGQVLIKCKENDLESKLTFSEESFFHKKTPHSIDGSILHKNKAQYQIFGAWNKQFVIKKNEKYETLWKKTHQENKQYYNFNEFSMNLNYLNKSLMKNLSPTDSRLRPDIRALEYQLEDDVVLEEKTRLEENVRQRKKQLERLKLTEFEPLWFDKEKLEGEDIYVENHKYWSQKIKSQWNQCSDIF